LNYSAKLLDYDLEIVEPTILFALTRIMTDSKDSAEKKFVERRKGGNRRMGGDRRAALERRHDSRNGLSGRKKNIRIWLRSLTNARLGVDRRKGERRQITDRRERRANALLTKEEIADLLSL